MLKMACKDEEQLVLDARENNAAFVKLYDKYYETMLGYIYRRTLDRNLAADICSETFLKAFQNIKRYEWRNLPFSAWLYRIASNEMNMADRKKKYRPASLDLLLEA